MPSLSRAQTSLFSLGLDSDGNETVIFNGAKCVRKSMENLTGRIS